MRCNTHGLIISLLATSTLSDLLIIIQLMNLVTFTGTLLQFLISQTLLSKVNTKKLNIQINHSGKLKSSHFNSDKTLYNFFAYIRANTSTKANCNDNVLLRYEAYNGIVAF